MWKWERMRATVVNEAEIEKRRRRDMGSYGKV